MEFVGRTKHDTSRPDCMGVEVHELNIIEMPFVAS